MHAFRDKMTRFLRENWLFLVVVGGVITAFLALRTPCLLYTSDAADESSRGGLAGVGGA